MNRFPHQTLIAGCLLCTLALTGCTMFGKDGKSNWRDKLPFAKKDKEPKPYPNPEKMAVTWTPDVILRRGSTPTRGFGGRIFFYDDNIRAVPVEGELAIEAIRQVPGKEPEVRRYAFTPEQFTSHYSQGDLGASYSIWVPWDAAGGESTKITLVPTFKSNSGHLLQGSSSVVNLPGKNPVTDSQFDLQHIAGSSGPYSGGAWSLGDTSQQQSMGLTTTTIPVRGGIPRSPGGLPQPQAVPGSMEAEQMLAKMKELYRQQQAAGASPTESAVQTATAEGNARDLSTVTPASAQQPAPGRPAAETGKVPSGKPPIGRPPLPMTDRRR